MPSLTEVVLSNSFQYKDDVTVSSAPSLPLLRIDIGALATYFQ